MVEVRLDAGGEALVASITAAAAVRSASRPGLPVTALIKSAAFDRMSFGPAEGARRGRPSSGSGGRRLEGSNLPPTRYTCPLRELRG